MINHTHNKKGRYQNDGGFFYSHFSYREMLSLFVTVIGLQRVLKQ